MSAGRLVPENTAANDRVIDAAATDRILRAATPNERPSLDQVEGDRRNRMPSDANRYQVKETAVHSSFSHGCQSVSYGLVLHCDYAALACGPFRHGGREASRAGRPAAWAPGFRGESRPLRNLHIVGECAARRSRIACEVHELDSRRGGLEEASASFGGMPQELLFHQM
jgi:hypothetical protein